MRNVLLINDTRGVGHHGSSAVVEVILQQFARRGIAVRSDLEHGLGVEDIGRAHCSAVVINGEGAMHGGQKNSHRFSRIGQQMRERNVPVFLINSVFDERTPEIVARMKHFTAIYCRERASVERLLANGVAAKLCPDLSFALQVPPDMTWRAGQRIVVLDTTVSDTNRLLHKFCRTSALPFQPIRAAPRLLRATSARNLMRIGRFNVTRALGKLLPSLYSVGRYANAIDDSTGFMRRITEGTLVVVAARFHGVCLCMKLGVPFIAIASNTPKIEGMLADGGLSGRMLSIDDLTLDLLHKRAPWSAADEDKRQRYVTDAQVSIDHMFDELARAISATSGQSLPSAATPS